MARIDFLSEQRLSLAEAAKLLGVHVTTAWRWILRGVRGHRLEAGYVGGRRFTTIESLERFIAAINTSPGETPPVRRSKQRERTIARAESDLKTAGI